MRILGTNDVELETPDLEKGYLTDDRAFVSHHDSVEEIPEKGHYEVIARYPNGGKDVAYVIDQPYVPAQEAWDEYEEILRYIPFSDEELAEREALNNKPTIEDVIAENKKLSAKLEAAIESNANLEDCLVEMAEVVYA